MGLAAVSPGLPGAVHRRTPLALAVLLHGGLLLAVLHGLNPALQRPMPREVTISLLPLQQGPAAPAQTTPAAIPQKKLPSLPAPSLPLPPPVQRQAVEPAPQPAPAVREAPAPAQATQAAAPVAPAAAAPAQETRAAAPAAAQAPAPTPAVQAQAPAERTPVTVSGVEYLVPPKPDYPIGAKRAGEQGKVTLRLLIDDKGHAERVDVQQSSGYPRLDEAARAAVLRAAFKPHLEDGRAVPVYVIVPISFNLR